MLYEKLKAATLAERKQRGEFVDFYTTLLGEVERIGKDNQREVTDADVIKVVNAFLKGVNENLGLLAPEEKRYPRYKLEKILLEGYLPKKLTDLELRAIISKFIESGLNRQGDIMAKLKADHAGQYEGKAASDITKELLSR